MRISIIFTMIAGMMSFGACQEAIKNNSNSMIIYSVTTKVDNSVLEDWLSWVDGHVEHVIETGRFSKATLSKVNGLDDTDGPTYNIQFHAFSAESLKAYRELDAPKLKAGTLKRFPEGLTNSRAEYTVIRDFVHK